MIYRKPVALCCGILSKINICRMYEPRGVVLHDELLENRSMRFFLNATQRMPLAARLLGVFAVLSALASVVLSAMAAHLPVFAQGVPASFASAQQMMQFHALAMLVALLWGPQSSKRWLGCAAAGLFGVGIVLFCINIDLRLLLDWQTARGLVPWGGAAFMLGWLCMLWAVFHA